MNKCLTTLFFTFFILIIYSTQTQAYSGKWTYEDGGGIFTNTVVPIDAAKAENTENINLSELKKGESVTRNILYLVESGNAGIERAAKKGGITKIKYIDSQTRKVFIPFGFIPILVKETKTIVYGE